MTRLALVLLFVAALAGCSKERSLTGTWHGVPKLPVESTNIIRKWHSGEEAIAMENDILGWRYVLELDGDMTYTMTLTRESGYRDVVSGTWHVNDNGSLLLLSAPKMSAEEIAIAKQNGATDADIDLQQRRERTFNIGDGELVFDTDTGGGIVVIVTFTR